jgi:hypothetical protein
MAEDPSIENIFEEKIAAHSVAEASSNTAAAGIKAASVAEPQRYSLRGFAASFA